MNPQGMSPASPQWLGPLEACGSVLTWGTGSAVGGGSCDQKFPPPRPQNPPGSLGLGVRESVLVSSVQYSGPNGLKLELNAHSSAGWEFEIGVSAGGMLLPEVPGEGLLWPPGFQWCSRALVSWGLWPPPSSPGLCLHMAVISGTLCVPPSILGPQCPLWSYKSLPHSRGVIKKAKRGPIVG